MKIKNLKKSLSIIIIILITSLATVGMYFYYQKFLTSDEIDTSKINQNQIIFSKKAIKNIKNIDKNKSSTNIDKSKRINPFD